MWSWNILSLTALPHSSYIFFWFSGLAPLANKVLIQKAPENELVSKFLFPKLTAGAHCSVTSWKSLNKTILWKEMIKTQLTMSPMNLVGLMNGFTTYKVKPNPEYLWSCNFGPWNSVLRFGAKLSKRKEISITLPGYFSVPIWGLSKFSFFLPQF